MPEDAQDRRIRRVREQFAALARGYYDEAGGFRCDRADVGEPDDRDRSRVALVLLDHGGEAERRIAEALLGRLFVVDGVDLTERSWRENFDEAAAPGAQAKDWNIFHSNNAAKILAAHAHRVGPETRAKLERIARRNAQRYAGSAQADYLPHGFNDNMPAGAMAGLILGGEAIGDAQAVSDGFYRLELFAEQLSRRGLIAEHASGTYTPITLSELASVAEHARDPAIRDLALACEARLWLDLLATFHPPTGHFAAAATRAYAVNSVGHCDGAACVVWAALGLPESHSPFDFMMAMKPGQITHFGGDRWKTFTGRASLLTRFHCPAELASATRDRAYPFRFAATAEHGGATTEPAAMQVFQGPRFGLATRTAMFQDGGQCDLVKGVGARREPVRDFADAATICTRFLLNDTAPGDPDDPTAEKILGGNAGVGRAVQRDGAALVVSRAGTASRGADAFAACRRIRQAVLVATHFGGPEAIRCGGEPVEALPFASAEDRVVCVDLGGVHLALTPLTMTRLERERALVIEEAHGFLTISFHSHDGPARDFGDEEIRSVFNGFFLEMADAADHASFDAFAAQAGPDAVEDWWFVETRRTRVRKGDGELAILWHTGADRLKAATVDGRPVGDAMLATNGFDASGLPFTDEPYRPNRFGPPAEALDVAWYPWLAHQRAPYNTHG